MIIWKKMFITWSAGHLHPWGGFGSMLVPGGWAVLKTAFQTIINDLAIVVYGKAVKDVCVFSHLVVSNSLRPHGLKPTRLFCPWDSPGKNAGAGCHFLLQKIFPTQGSNLHLLHLLCWQTSLYGCATWEAPVRAGRAKGSSDFSGHLFHRYPEQYPYCLSIWTQGHLYKPFYLNLHSIIFWPWWSNDVSLHLYVRYNTMWTKEITPRESMYFSLLVVRKGAYIEDSKDIH